MSWLKCGKWRAFIALAGLLAILVFMVFIPLSASAYAGALGMVQVTATVDVTATMTALNEEKLVTDIRKENSDISWGWTAVGTIFIGSVGVLLTFIQFLRTRRDTQDKELRDRQAAHDKDLRAQAEERFKAAVAALGDKNEGTQVGAAILLRSFLREEDKKIYERYYAQIFDLAVAYLRLSNTSQPSRDSKPMDLSSLRHALVVVLQESYLPVRNALMDQKKTAFDHRILDASRICLDGAYLVEANRNHIWMIDAFLIGARLGRAKLHKADIRRSIICDTFLNRADFIDV